MKGNGKVFPTTGTSREAERVITLVFKDQEVYAKHETADKGTNAAYY